MNRTTTCFAGLLLAVTPLAFGQEPQLTTPQVPEDALATRQLIAWSRLQKPQPAPQPLPPRDTPIPQPDQQDQPDQQAKRPADPENQQVPVQSFTGKVASNSTYQLDAQGDVKQYENQDVKVIGNLDSSSNTIRVVKIELLS
jgi:outer membrane biosynthesis protein TonB